MNIILIGFMGAGKSSVCRSISKILAIPAVDLDQRILASSKLNSINAIFEELGEDHFRQLEFAELKKVLSEPDVVLATGGGVIESKDCRHLLQSSDHLVVYLKTSFDSISQRLKDVTDRPLFQDKQKAKSLYENRLALYESVANVSVNTDMLSIEQVAENISDILRSRAHSNE